MLLKLCEFTLNTRRSYHGAIRSYPISGPRKKTYGVEQMDRESLTCNIRVLNEYMIYSKLEIRFKALT